MKRFLILGSVAVFLMATAGMAFADYQYSLPTSSELYDINWAAHMVDGTGYIPSSEDPDPTDTYHYSSWQDPTDPRDDGTLALGTPDMVYGDPEGVYEMWGGATGISGKQSPDNWFVLGFDQALTNRTGDDMIVYQFGWFYDMEIYVSTDAAYDSEDMTWISLGLLDMTSKPFTWGDYGTSPSMLFDFGDYGITGDVNFVKFAGMGHWVDAVGAAPVPLPGAVWLLGSGLLAFLGVRRKSGK